MKRIYYEYPSLKKFIARLVTDYGYNCVQTWEGSLGIGTWICIPPDERHYYFIICEEYKNEWCSTHWMMKCRTLPKKWQKELEDYENGK